jgi:dephospho-CoA kinase
LRILKADILAQKKKGARLIVIDAALIFEWGIANWCDYVLVVTANKGIRLNRLMKSGLSRKLSLGRINSQIPDRDKAALADFVIENNGSKAQLGRRIDEFLSALQECCFKIDSLI